MRRIYNQNNDGLLEENIENTLNYIKKFKKFKDLFESCLIIAIEND